MFDLPIDHSYDIQNSSPVSHYEWVADMHFQPSNAATTALAFRHMDETPDGWCSKLKAYWMMNFIFLKKPKVIVEIGVWAGKSLIPMARAVKDLGEGGKVYGIDPWSADASVIGMDKDNIAFWKNQQAHEQIYQELRTRIKVFGLDDTVQLVRAKSEDASIIANIDILHIDGNHSEEMSFKDVVKWVPEVVSGGLIFLDDLTWTINGKPSVQKAMDWLDEHCIRLTEVPDVDNHWGIWVKK